MALQKTTSFRFNMYSIQIKSWKALEIEPLSFCSCINKSHNEIERPQETKKKPIKVEIYERKKSQKFEYEVVHSVYTINTEWERRENILERMKTIRKRRSSAEPKQSRERERLSGTQIGTTKTNLHRIASMWMWMWLWKWAGERANEWKREREWLCAELTVVENSIFDVRAAHMQ